MALLGSQGTPSAQLRVCADLMQPELLLCVTMMCLTLTLLPKVQAGSVLTWRCPRAVGATDQIPRSGPQTGMAVVLRTFPGFPAPRGSLGFPRTTVGPEAKCRK